MDGRCVWRRAGTFSNQSREKGKKTRKGIDNASDEVPFLSLA